MSQNVGRITQIMGAIVDVQFDNNIPDLLNALHCTLNDKRLVLEVAQHIGDGVVRAIAMDSINGLARGAEVVDTGKQIEVPVGRVTLGRIFNVVGEVIDEQGAVEAKEYRQIHAETLLSAY